MIDTRINNRYLITNELGRGGMGIVYRAHDTLLERDVAVKVLWTSALGSQGRARLLREAQAAARLNHPNIINIYDAGDTDGLSYIVMELLDGESLFDHRPQMLDEILRIIQQICQALDHAHRHGIIHRDLKPENVIVTSKGIAKLTDFGLSRSVTARISQEGGIVGTVYYLAPEQALRQEIDFRADLYALGVMIYELVTGRLPFTADDPLGVISQHLNAPVVPPSTYNTAIPPALEALILRLMSKEPDERPESAQAVLEALDRIYEEPAEYDSAILTGLSPLDRMVRGRLIGRKTEFNQIKTLWRQISRSQSGEEIRENVLYISGDPGIGKTPLIKEVRSLAQVSGAHMVVGECDARENAPYSPIIRLLREVQPLPDALPDLVIADLRDLAPDLDLRPVPERQPLSPLSEQQRLFESLFALFATMTERQPLMVVLEDAQWADASTLLFIRHLARRSRATALKLMIILTYRPGEIDDNSTFNNVLLDLSQERLSEIIPLQPFTRDQTRELLSTMFMQEISENFLNAIYRVTEGNLYFIEEVCRALIEEGMLVCGEGGWQFTFTGAENLVLPVSVRSALQARIARLPETAQDFLRMAAIIGREFDYEILRRACERQTEDELIEAIEMAQRAQLINEIPGSKRTRNGGGEIVSERFAFAHTLIQAFLREELSSLRRRRVHRRVAEAIEAVYPDDLETLAHHFAEAGDTEKARFYTIRAGDRARKLYANADALRFYNEALALTPADHPDRFRILSARSKVYHLLAERDLQRADIEGMLQLAERQDDETMLCDALISLADLYMVTENVHAYDPARRAVEIAQKLQDPIREGRALRCVGWSAYVRLDFHESLSSLETAVARFRQAGMLAQAAECLHMLSLVTGLQGLGELPVSQKYAEDAVNTSRLAGDPRQEAISLRRVAIVKYDAGQFEEGMAIVHQALSLHRDLGDRLEECNALNALGVSYSLLGKKEEALNYFRQAYQMALALGANGAIWMVTANLEWHHYRREGLFEEFLAFADQILNRPETRSDTFLLTNLLQLKAKTLADLGQFPAAVALLREALQLADQFAGAVVRSDVRLGIAWLQSEMGQFASAHEVLEEAREFSRQFERPVDVAAVHATEAEIARREWETGSLRHIHTAAAQIEMAINLLRNTHWNYELAFALTRAAWIALGLNQSERALQYVQEAEQLFGVYAIKPEYWDYLQACVLWATGADDEANQFLEKAYQRVMSVANAIQNPDLRKSWLEDVYYNHQIVNDWVNYHEL